VIVTPETLEEAVSVLAGKPKLALDCETSGLREHDRPFSVIIADRDSSYYFDNRLLRDSSIYNVIKDLIRRDTTVAMQNAKFDMRMVGHQWCSVAHAQVEDTEVLGRLVRNDHFTYGLDAQVKRNLGLEKSDEAMKYIAANKLFTMQTSPYKDKREKLLHFDQIPMEVISAYAIKDARLTYDLHSKLIDQLDLKSVPVWQNEKELTKVCYAMERRGITVNVDYTKQALEYESGLIREAKNQFHMATGQVYDNKKTTLVEIFKKAGETVPLTEKGNDQLTDDVLESFTSPAAKLVQKIRFHEKRISTYYSSFLELSDSNNVIHADMRQAGTTTGRFSYREPNLQNIPKEEDSTDQFVVRGCFKPRPGYAFVSMDYKQQEYRLMLAYAKHTELIRQVMGGADVHQATADLVGISRKHAKTLNFAILYGAGAEKIAWMLGITIQEAAALKKKYFDKLLEVEKLIFDITKIGGARGYVYNWLGRKLCISNRDFSYTLPNHLIQSGGADICKLAMVGCHDYLRNYDSSMVLQIHDAIVFEMKLDEMDHLIPRLKKIMIDVFPGKNGMRMDVDVTVSNVSLAERDMVTWR
jgi:DNA polymerase-1